MLQIKCPWCGVRDEAEFRFGGESSVVRPQPNASDTEWADYLFYRENPKGMHSERWLHRYGCRQWFNAMRDTTTHEIHATYRIGQIEPAGGSAFGSAAVKKSNNS